MYIISHIACGEQTMKYPPTFEQPTTDSLSGLLTSAYFRHLIREDLIPAAERTGDPLSLAFVDIDNFLHVNETYGRECGDAVLQFIARTLQETLPDSAAMSRYSGDEFAAALPDTRLDDTFTLMEEFRRRVASTTLPDWPDLRLTCSIGLASFPANGHNDVELIRQADEAVYTAKVNGRNRIALPLADSRMITKTSHYTAAQLDRLSTLAKTVKRNEASLLREALDDLLKKYNDRLNAR